MVTKFILKVMSQMTMNHVAAIVHIYIVCMDNLFRNIPNNTKIFVQYTIKRSNFVSFVDFFFHNTIMCFNLLNILYSSVFSLIFLVTHFHFLCQG